jgi:hypothetical protein
MDKSIEGMSVLPKNRVVSKVNKTYFCTMFFKTAYRVNPATGQPSIYYRLIEGSRNVLGSTYHRHILTAGFMEDIT